MRSWIGGVCLAGVTAGGLGFVLTGGPKSSHVGPCVSAPCRTPAVRPEPLVGPSEVVDVVPPAALASVPVPEPRRLPFVNFDEPPLASVTPAGFAAEAGPDRIPLAE